MIPLSVVMSNELLHSTPQLALAEEADDNPGREQRLKEKVAELLLKTVAAHRPELAAEQVRELLSLDIDLNAQGLEVWLKRRAKTAGRG